MRRALRENAVCAFMAATGCATLAWLGLYGYAWNDYELEAQPAVEAIAHGHLEGFMRLAPAYGGSLLERAPFALLPGLWGGGSLAVYRSVAFPCLLGAGVFAVYLVARMRASGHRPLARAVALGICVANPIALRAIELGHPEELLGACMCVLAVFLAAGSFGGRARPLLAGLVLGLAIANKEWALLAVGPVMLAVAPGRRRICLASAAALAVAILAPLALTSSSGFDSSTRSLASAPASIFQPWQVWWFLGHHSTAVHGTLGESKAGYRTAPAWVETISRPLILLVGATLAALLWLRRRTLALGEQDALLALALLLLVRCLLDTWDTAYYALPFIIALLAWEVANSARRPPVLALSATALVWVSVEWLPHHVGPDTQSLFFLAWTLPLAAWLAVRLLWPERASFTLGSPRRRVIVAQETTVSSFPSPLSTS
jgi:glycosyl transferase family 87